VAWGGEKGGKLWRGRKGGRQRRRLVYWGQITRDGGVEKRRGVPARGAEERLKTGKGPGRDGRSNRTVAKTEGKLFPR